MKGLKYDYITSNLKQVAGVFVKYSAVESSSVENEEVQPTTDDQNNSMVSDGENNSKCNNIEEFKEEEFSFQLDKEKLAQAIIYSEILGKPKCKTRRRG